MKRSIQILVVLLAVVSLSLVQGFFKALEAKLDTSSLYYRLPWHYVQQPYVCYGPDLVPEILRIEGAWSVTERDWVTRITVKITNQGRDEAGPSEAYIRINGTRELGADYIEVPSLGPSDEFITSVDTYLEFLDRRWCLSADLTNTVSECDETNNFYDILFH